MSKKLSLWEKMFPGLAKLEVKPEIPDTFTAGEVDTDIIAGCLVELMKLFISQQFYADAQDKAERRSARLNFKRPSEYWRGLADGAADAAYWLHLAVLNELDSLEAGDQDLRSDRLAGALRSVLEADARKAEPVPDRVIDGQDDGFDIPVFVEGSRLDEAEAKRVLALLEGGAA